MDNQANAVIASNYDPTTKTKAELIVELTKLRNELDVSKSKIVKSDLSCDTKLKQIKHRMRSLKIEHNEAKQEHSTRRRHSKQGNKDAAQLRLRLKSQAKQCTDEMERLNGLLKTCQQRQRTNELWMFFLLCGVCSIFGGKCVYWWERCWVVVGGCRKWSASSSGNNCEKIEENPAHMCWDKLFWKFLRNTLFCSNKIKFEIYWISVLS